MKPYKRYIVKLYDGIYIGSGRLGRCDGKNMAHIFFDNEMHDIQDRVRIWHTAYLTSYEVVDITG